MNEDALRAAAQQVDRSRYSISHGSVGGHTEAVSTAALDALRAALASSRPEPLDVARLRQAMESNGLTLGQETRYGEIAREYDRLGDKEGQDAPTE